MYSLEDYEKAKAELEALRQRWDNYSGNNADKYQAGLKAARVTLRRIEEFLKEKGALPMSDYEKLERSLDATFPNARHKEVVEFMGKK